MRRGVGWKLVLETYSIEVVKGRHVHSSVKGQLTRATYLQGRVGRRSGKENEAHHVEVEV